MTQQFAEWDEWRKQHPDVHVNDDDVAYLKGLARRLDRDLRDHDLSIPELMDILSKVRAIADREGMDSVRRIFGWLVERFALAVFEDGEARKRIDPNGTMTVAQIEAFQQLAPKGRA